MPHRRIRPGPSLRFVLVAAALPLSGCGALLSEGAADVAGVGGSAVSSAITSNATVAAAIGLGVRSVAKTGVQYAERVVHRAEQDAIARSAGALAPGTVGVWSIRHTIPLESDKVGEVVVARDLGGGSFRCKEIVFSVDTNTRKGLQRGFYTATICDDGGTWRWASAEPATERWGNLQ